MTTTNGRPLPYEVWRIPFEFEEDPSRSKMRPAVVAEAREDEGVAVLLKVTGHGPRPEFPGEVRLDGWAEAGLPRPSTVRCSKRMQLPFDAFENAARYGKLTPEDARRVQRGITESDPCGNG